MELQKIPKYNEFLYIDLVYYNLLELFISFNEKYVLEEEVINVELVEKPVLQINEENGNLTIHNIKNSLSNLDH